MGWWTILSDKINVGDELFTPGRGNEGLRKKPFRIISKTPSCLNIASGKSKIPLEKECFEAIEKAFAFNSILWLRVASLRASQPLEDSVDKLVRDATRSKLARGNYICAILEHLGLVQYSMQGNKKGVELSRDMPPSISESSNLSNSKPETAKISREKLLKVWEIIRWFDEVRWNEEEMKRELIPGPEFKTLTDDGKMLVHWLSYITDQQRPYQDVWRKGGPILAELVSTYKTNPNHSIDILKHFTRQSKKKDGIDSFQSKSQLLGGGNIEYTPRFGMHILSVARVLIILESYQRSFVKYLSDNWWFVQSSENIDGDNWVSRMAFILYLLAYNDITRGIVSYHANEKKINKNVERYIKWLKKLFSNKDRLLQTFEKWSKRDRYHKRLWASLRDYLKPESAFHDYFTRAIKDLGNTELSTFLANRKSDIYGSLELPGDIWNLRFIENIFNGSINSPEDLRSEYENLSLPQNPRKGTGHL